jgi:hypothetical protein
MSDRVLVVPVRVATGAVAVLLLIAVAAVIATQPATREAVGRAADPRTTADPPALDRQRTSTEHAIQRGYLKATDQLVQVRRLTLAISASEAAAIDDRARVELRAIRRDALGGVGMRLGLASPALDAYVATAEAQLSDNAFTDDRPVLLAPDLFAVVARADELFQQSADAATRELTKAPSVTPRPSPTPSPAPRP